VAIFIGDNPQGGCIIVIEVIFKAGSISLAILLDLLC
jgi:hypothetical protein